MSFFRQRKLKVYSAGPAATVYVFQDGSDVDADATAGYQFDDAFTQGAQRPDTTARADREQIELRELRTEYETGRQFTFAYRGRQSWIDTENGAARFQPNDLVEFWAEAPTPDATVTMPSWHLNEATPGDQVRLFRGWVESVQTSPENGCVVVCTDAVRKADDLILSRPGVTGAVPKLVFNAASDDPDFYWSVKVTNQSLGTVTWGEAANTPYRATVKQILEWLWSEYEAELVTLGVIESGTDLFHADDLAVLTGIPGPILLERTGFGSAVREILRWVPDRRLLVDHNTGQWRIVAWGAALKKDSTTLYQHFATTGNPYVDVVRVPLAANSYFSATPGADGNRVRIYSSADPTRSEEFQIHSKNTSGPVGGEVQLFTVAGLRHQVYPSGSVVAPVRSETLPTLARSIDTATRIELHRDLQGAYSAVNLYSVHQKTETINENTYPGISSPRLKPAWNSGFDQYWKDKDADREADWGKDALGLKVYRVDATGARDVLYVRHSDSAYGDDHAPNEWQGTTLWVWTKNGGTDAKAASHVWEVYSQANVADVGDGSPGLAITLVGSAGGFATAVTNFNCDGGTDIGSPAGGSADRVVLTSDKQFSTTAASNRRSVVGRFWWLDETTDSVAGATSGPHQSSCSPAKIQYDNGYGGIRRTVALDAGSAYPSANWRAKGDFDYVGGGGAGTTLIWRRRSVVTARPIAAACGGQPGWAAPPNFMVTVERTKNTARSARFPTSGHAGHAHEAYNLTRELHIPVDVWENDDEDASFAALAELLWNAHQNAHSKGTVRFRGHREHGVWLDLAVRVALTTDVYPSDQAAGVEGFWGPLSSFAIDFEREEVEYGFDSASALERLLDDVYFRLFKAYNQKPQSILALARKAAELISCIAGARTDQPPTSVCSGSVYEAGGRPLPPVVKLPNKDDQNNGIVPTGLGMADATGAAAEGGQGVLATHGGGAVATVVRDAEGNHFAVGGRGEIVPGTVSGNEFTPSTSLTTQPRGKLDRTEDEVEGIAALWGGLQLAHEAYRPIYGRTNSGSTTSVVEAKAPALPVVADATGWSLVIGDYRDRLARETYEVDAIAIDAITLASAIADDAGAPAEDVPFILIPPGKPLPDPGDFTVDGSFGFQDDAGNWYVFEPDGSTGTVFRASLSGVLLEKVASGSGTLTMKVGPTAGNANVAVEIDFSGATVVGLSGGGGGGAAWDFDEGDAATTYAVGTIDLEGGDST